MTTIKVPSVFCFVGNLKAGGSYLDNGGDIFLVTDMKAPVDDYIYTVNTRNGKMILTRKDIKLAKDDNGNLYASAFLNGWSDDPSF